MGMESARRRTSDVKGKVMIYHSRVIDMADEIVVVLPGKMGEHRSTEQSCIFDHIMTARERGQKNARVLR